MSQLPTLIADLALILICAGVMTLLFKKLKQPLVLGYVVAGFLASPHMPYTPSVMDTTNIKTWADIGVIFLLFALGLEFSFKKIVKVGGSAIIAALYHHLLYDFVGYRSRYGLWLAPDGQSVSGWYDCDVVYHYYL